MIDTEEKMIKYLKKNFPNISLKPITIKGFECIHHYCKLDKGWYPNHSEIDEYELYMVIKHSGSIIDRKKWNLLSDDKFSVDFRSFEKEQKNLRVLKRDISKKTKFTYGRKAFEIYIKKLKKAGVPIQRRTNKDQYKGLYYFSIERDSELFSLISGNDSGGNTAILYIPNEKGFPFINCDYLSSPEELISLVNETSINKITEVDIINKKYKFYII